MSSVRGARSSSVASGPIRVSFAQSSATSTRSPSSGGAPRSSPFRAMNEYSVGSGASPYRYIWLSLPSASSPSLAASSEPSASPSGFSCVTSTKRSCERIASATAFRSSVVFWRELIDELGHADPALDRRIVLEGQLGRPLHSELLGQAGLQDPVRGGEAVQCPLPLSLGTEHADENRGMTQVGRGLDTRDGDEADPRILELDDSFRDHLADGLVHSAHPVAHAGIQAVSRRG